MKWRWSPLRKTCKKQKLIKMVDLLKKITSDIFLKDLSCRFFEKKIYLKLNPLKKGVLKDV